MAKDKDNLITSQYRYIKELADEKYASEVIQEANLIQQSSQMQTAFSFVTGAVFMAAPICIDNRGSVPLVFYMVSLSAITTCILVSLILASIAQWRWKRETFPDIDVIRSSVVDSTDWKKLTKEEYQLVQHVDLLAMVQKEKARLNERRVKLIMGSMIFFWISIACVVISFIVGLLLHYGR